MQITILMSYPHHVKTIIY